MANDRVLGIPLKNPQFTKYHKLQHVTVDDMARLIGYKMPDEFETGDLWSYAFSEAKKEGNDEEDAHEHASNVANKEEERLFVAMHEAIKAAFGAMLDEHGLEFQPLKTKPWVYRIMPSKAGGWHTAAAYIRGTINGVGMFGFDSTKEFLDSGPYTAREAVLSHLGWMKDWARVYGDPSFASRVRFE